MKIRQGFVSNSSSSSFVCDICGAENSGWDMCLSEAEMYECENGHIICESHCIDKINEIGKETIVRNYITKYINENENSDIEYKKNYIDIYKEFLANLDDDTDDDVFEEFMDEYMEFRYHLPAELCPICSFDSLIDEDIAKYSLKKLEQTRDKLKEEIKNKFNSYDEFRIYLK